MDTRIALAGTPIDPVGALSNGFAAGLQTAQGRRQNALAQLYQTQGPGIMAGDPGALNSLAQFDPTAAMGIQSQQLGMQAQRQDMAFSAERMQMARDEAKKAAAEAAAKMTAEQRAAEAAQLNTVLRGAAAAYATGDKAAYDGFLRSKGVDPAQYPFDQFPAFAAMGDGVLEALKTTKDLMAPPPPPTPLSSEGKLQSDLRNGLITQEQYNAALAPKGPLVTVNTGEGGKFFDTLDTKQAEMFGALMDQGNAARRNIGVLSQMSSLLEQIPTGIPAMVQRYAGQFGISTEGLDNIQAAEAMINQLVPQQRAPGSGTMSDRDIDLFKASLPSLINTPEGNKKIMETMKGLAEYSLAQAKIAQQVADREITPAEGRAKLAALPNPLAQYQQGAAPSTGATEALSPEAQDLLNQWQ